MDCTDWGYPLQCFCLFSDIWCIGKCYWYFTSVVLVCWLCSFWRHININIIQAVFFSITDKRMNPERILTEAMHWVNRCFKVLQKRNLCLWQVSNDCFYLQLAPTCNCDLSVRCRSVDASFTCCYLKIMITRDHTKQLGKLYPTSECSANAEKPSRKYFLCNGSEYIAHNMVWFTLPSGSFTYKSIRPFMNGPPGLPRMHWPNKSISIWRWNKHGLVLLVCAQTLQGYG